ncbi:SAV_2336 N-terminal domain-related protein [Streptomyces sp. NBC_00385]|uniref:SAV_2336 N-terminal domain-related protein n=1 Tax=Streptomyces sp. NBC_00385 TaxID=2975733 RepID=UPI002DDC5656|nr:SAV_2336 N-terminal domain-related protein [Streptomyces sp. NBC_00385]WRZ03851.1 SAV_2336 family protein [Streptomyces sp. NBC_00385]
MPGPDESAGSEPLATLVARLRAAGLDPGVEQLCDALWLAGWTRGTDGPPEDRGEGGGAPVPAGLPGEQVAPGRAASGAAPDDAVPDPGGDDRADRPAGPRDDGRISLYPDPGREPPRGGDAPPPGRRSTADAPATALAFGVPAAPVLPDPLELTRALRPLQRYHPASAPLRHVLDETATAELSARAGGMVMPVFRGVRRGEAILQCVMDASSSMLVWDRMFGELQRIFAQLGAFRDVQVRYLHQGPDGGCAVSRSSDPVTGPLHSADRLSDPTGRRVTVVISDCAGPLWHSGRAHRLLHQLARQSPVAVLQPLPQRMWNRTRLPVTFGSLSRGDGPAGATLLKVVEDAGTGPAVHPGALAVPVLPPVADALASWARLLSGTGEARIPGAVGWVRGDQPAAAAQRSGGPLSSLQLVSRFRSVASPAAGQLAVYLAAAPLYLPVMQLVQRTMLPHSGPSELAEVLLSGLLTRADGGGGRGQWYAFAPGVQDALLGPLGRDEALLVLKHCSQYIEQRFGKGGPNFPALAFAQLGDGALHDSRHSAATAAGGAWDSEENGDGEEKDESGIGGGTGEHGRHGARGVPHAFAEVAARVLERFMPVPPRFVTRDPDAPGGLPASGTSPAVEQARELVRQFEADTMVQRLIDAVLLLRGAAESSPPPGAGPELWAEYARCTLRLWEVRGGADLLGEAGRAAERAVAYPGAVHERAVLAQVLHARADDRRRRGDRRGALELLRRAEREYTAACAAPGLAPAEALRLTLERVRGLEAQWRLDGDSALLQSACGMLEAFADSWPDEENRPAALPLQHGRTLLRLAGATEDTEQSREYARQSARSLRTVFALGDGHTTATGNRIVLDLVDALLASGEEPDEAAALTGRALETVREQRQRAQLQTRAGRIRAARYEHTGDPDELVAATNWFARAARGTPRDSRAHTDLLAEWGATLLRRAELPDGGAHIGAAVRVLRDCRSETPSGGAHQSERLLMLGRALMLRHRATADRVDLREAEYLFGLAAQEAADPLTGARCWLELGRAHLAAADVLDRPARRDDAAEAFRSAAESAAEAEAEQRSPQRTQEAVELGATANHWRGMTYERAGRPRAARDAYRAARQEWRKLPDGGGAAGESTAGRLAELER